jgi:hypothetical protein
MNAFNARAATRAVRRLKSLERGMRRIGHFVKPGKTFKVKVPRKR